MSGIEPFLMSALAAAGEAATAVGSTVASAASSVGSAVGVGGTAAGTAGASAASAGELALLASAKEAAAIGLSSGLTTSQAIAGAGALSSAAGAGASLLAKPPKVNAPTMPTRDNARMEADQRSLALKRRGRAATLLTGSEGVTSAPTLGSPSLTGTA